MGGRPAVRTKRDAGHSLVLIGCALAFAVIALVVAPGGLNRFGPPKLAALLFASTLVAAGISLSPQLRRLLVARLKASKLAWVAGVTWSLVVFSTAFSVSPPQSLTGTYPEYAGVIAWFAASIVAVGAVALSWGDEWALFARAAVTSSLVVGVYGLAMAASAAPTAASGSMASRVISTLGNSSNAGVFALLAAPIAVERLRRERAVGWRVLAGAALAATLGLLLFAQSRGAWLGALVACGIWLLVERPIWSDPRRRRTVLVALLVAVLFLASVIGLTPQLRNRFSEKSLQTVGWRLAVWRAGAKMTLSRPALGWGPNSFRFVYPGYRLRNLEENRRAMTTVGDAHNVVVNAGASLGLLGVIALLAIVVLVSLDCGMIARTARLGDVRGPMLSASLGGFFVALLFHYPSLDTLPMAAVLVGMAVSLAGPRVETADVRRERASLSPRGSRVAAIFVALLAGVLCIAAVGLVIADNLQRGAYVAAAQGEGWSAVHERIARAQSFAPWEPSLWWSEGKLAAQALERGNDPTAYEQGLAAFSRAGRALHSYGPLKYDLAQLYAVDAVATRDASQLDQAYTVFDGLVAADRYNPVYRSARGMVLGQRGNYAAAEADLRFALELNPRLKAARTALVSVQRVRNAQ